MGVRREGGATTVKRERLAGDATAGASEGTTGCGCDRGSESVEVPKTIEATLPLERTREAGAAGSGVEGGGGVGILRLRRMSGGGLLGRGWGGDGIALPCFKKLERCGLETVAAGCWFVTDTWSNVIDPLLACKPFTRISNQRRRRRRRRAARSCVKQIN